MTIGDDEWTLQDPTFSIVREMDAINASSATSVDAKMVAWSRIRELISDEELRMVKTRAKAGLIRGLQSNGGIAGQLATAQAQFGDWREIFDSVSKIEAVTKQDIQRVARETGVVEEASHTTDRII